MAILPVVTWVVHRVDKNIYRHYIFGDILPVEVCLDFGIWFTNNISSISLHSENQVACKWLKSLRVWVVGGWSNQLLCHSHLMLRLSWGRDKIFYLLPHHSDLLHKSTSRQVESWAITVTLHISRISECILKYLQM